VLTPAPDEFAGSVVDAALRGLDP